MKTTANKRNVVCCTGATGMRARCTGNGKQNEKKESLVGMAGDASG